MAGTRFATAANTNLPNAYSQGATMFRYLHSPVAVLLIALPFISGCDGSASTTDDSTKLELEVPKVEIGDDPMDLNPATDVDVDIDTPMTGDS
jgi:hypothetical protein